MWRLRKLCKNFVNSFFFQNRNEVVWVIWCFDLGCSLRYFMFALSTLIVKILTDWQILAVSVQRFSTSLRLICIDLNRTRQYIFLNRLIATSLPYFTLHDLSWNTVDLGLKRVLSEWSFSAQFFFILNLSVSLVHFLKVIWLVLRFVAKLFNNSFAYSIDFRLKRTFLKLF